MPSRILTVSPDEYHALPHFSATRAKTLIAKSPLHAKALTEIAPTEEMDRGAIVHRLVLGKGADYAVLPFDDWRTKAAKGSRDAARAAKRVPIKESGFAQASLIAESVRTQLAERGIVLDGRSELAIEWTEETEHGPVLCKGMLDHCWLDTGLIIDLKVTENAAPSAIERTSENLGYAIQWAAYTRALAALDPDLAGHIGFAFVFCEPEAPFAVNVAEPDGVFQQLGIQRWRRAVTTWAECTKNNAWPGYGARVNPLTAPAWALAREGYSPSEI